MADAEPEAKAGEIAASPEAWGIIKSNMEGEVINQKAIKLLRSKEGVVFPTPDKIHFGSDLTKSLGIDAVKKLKSILSCYAPRPVILNIDESNSKWIAELRVVTILFIRLVGLKFTTKL